MKAFVQVLVQDIREGLVKLSWRPIPKVGISVFLIAFGIFGLLASDWSNFSWVFLLALEPVGIWLGASGIFMLVCLALKRALGISSTPREEKNPVSSIRIVIEANFICFLLMFSILWVVLLVFFPINLVQGQNIADSASLALLLGFKAMMFSTAMLIAGVYASRGFGRRVIAQKAIAENPER